MDTCAIRICGVKKKYRLGQIGGGSLQKDLQSWWARKRGKEDPNTKVGTDTRLIGQEFMALDGIDLEIKQGEAVGIIGPNGAGKSTLLKLLSRVTAPSEGTIDIYGRITSMLEVGTGFHSEMTGRENIYLNGAILGMTKAEIDAKMEQIIDFSEIREFIDTPVKRYSSGMYVKLAFSVAAHLDSEIMIMDEVLAVGDLKFQQKCLKKMREAATAGRKTVLYVSHNMNTIRQLCDRCIVLHEGKIIFDGEVEEGIRRYMDTANDELPVVYDLGSLHRKPGLDDRIRMKSFRFLNKTNAVFEVTKNPCCELTLDSEIPLSSARLVISVKTGDGQQIGVSLSEEFAIRQGKNQKITFYPDLSVLSQGRYCLNLAIIEKYEDGNYTVYDSPEAKIHLILRGMYAHGILWYRQYWGNVNLPITNVESS